MKKPIYDHRKLLLIAGPCSIESEQLCEEVARVLCDLQERYKDVLKIVFKSSFDKANRTDVHSKRGIGFDKGLEILSNIKNQFHLPVTTDIHLPEQANGIASVCDVIQVPAFLCRQTDLLEASAKTGAVVNVKKGQFLSPYDMRFVVEKLKYFGASEIWQTERGTMFGYGNLVVDMRSFSIMRRNECPVIFDVTHSLQMPSMGQGFTGGDRQFALCLARGALAAGVQGLFVETHPNPSQAWSDKATQLPLQELPEALHQCLKVWDVVNR